MLLNCGIGEYSWDFLGCKEIQPVHSKRDQSWVFIGRTDTKGETPVLRPPHTKSWLIGKDSILGRIGGRMRREWQRFRWLDCITDWTWVWVNSGIWWWTGRYGILHFMGLQRVRYNLVTELDWILFFPQVFWSIKHLEPFIQSLSAPRQIRLSTLHITWSTLMPTFREERSWQHSISGQLLILLYLVNKNLTIICLNWLPKHLASLTNFSKY